MFEYEIHKNDESLENLNIKDSKKTYPLLDVYELEDKFIVAVELPGVEKSGIKIKFDEGELIISANKFVEDEYKAIHSERIFGEMKRTVKFHTDIDADGIRAEYENGLLKVFLRKIRNRKEIKIN